MRRELRAHGVRLAAGARRLQQAHPGVRLLQQGQRLDELSLRLARAARALLAGEGRRLGEARLRLRHQSPERALAQQRARGQELAARLRHAVQAHAARAAHRLALAQRGLHAVSPLATLTRGFAIVTGPRGELVTDAQAVHVGEEIEAQLARGRLRARVTGRK